ncbi:hypothetical protein NX059_001868 [Plenodomus lindquistii]|nr:hypothetical protein NX059_001868 [Plenodomus lindquistii]
MAITIHTATDDDIPRACEIETAAYQNKTLNRILAPGPFPPESRQRRISQLIQLRRDNSTAFYLKAVDEESGKMIAFAKWHIFETSEAAAAFARPLVFGPGWNSDACMAFFGGLTDRKKQLVGDRPHLYLHILHTDPEFQGRGAGRLLVEWGTRRADELSLPAYLESTAAGHRLYKSQGFKDVDNLEVDLSPWDGPMYMHALMLRAPAEPLHAIA